jgi:predicted RNA-binding Zn-ribbon protein involved in translation (DUF1610 family)
MEEPRPLKSLKDWNATHGHVLPQERKNIPNGIACPECGTELVDTDRSFRTASCPPKYTVACQKCGYHGWRNC